jgi:lincosamide nucleotidyltransferase A/C/D/E
VEGVEVLRVMRVLERAGVAAGISGGWGIDALLGRQSRPHGDLDLGIDARSLDSAIAALASVGYAVASDERPARVEMSATTGRVDLHPIVWAEDGSGVQTGFDGEQFEYPAGSLGARGVIDGGTVACATPDLQLAFHSHYAPRDHDRRDMAALAERFGLTLPPAYSD